MFSHIINHNYAPLITIGAPLSAASRRQLKHIPRRLKEGIKLRGDGPAAIVLFTFRIYVAVVPYSTFPASSRR